MQIRSLDDIVQFDRLKSNWDSVYAADPHAQVFLSWSWLRGWLEVTPYKWFILTARPTGAPSCVAFLPLALRLLRRRRVLVCRELQMGGKPLSPYTGFCTLPHYEGVAIAAFRRHVRNKLRWDRFILSEVLDPRLDAFLEGFPHSRFDITKIGQICCPYIDLPYTWEEYIRTHLSKSNRKRFRRHLRAVDRNGDLRITHGHAMNIDTYIETLLRFWQARWGAKSAKNLETYRAAFRWCFANGDLWIAILWSESTPIGARAAFLDRKRMSFCAYMSAWHDGYAAISPGAILRTYSIRYAILNGFRTYDFSLGDQEYKYAFGVQERFTTSVKIERRSLRTILTCH